MSGKHTRLIMHREFYECLILYAYLCVYFFRKIVPEGFSQMGTVHGGVNINDSHHDDSSDLQHQLYLYGFRTREIISSIGFTTMLDAFPVLGKSTENKQCLLRDNARRLELFAICDDGDGFRLTAVNGMSIEF